MSIGFVAPVQQFGLQPAPVRPQRTCGRRGIRYGHPDRRQAPGPTRRRIAPLRASGVGAAMRIGRAVVTTSRGGFRCIRGIGCFPWSQDAAGLPEHEASTGPELPLRLAGEAAWRPRTLRLDPRAPGGVRPALPVGPAGYARGRWSDSSPTASLRASGAAPTVARSRARARSIGSCATGSDRASPSGIGCWRSAHRASAPITS